MLLPEPVLRSPPSIHSHSHLCVKTQRLAAICQKKATSQSLAITIDIHGKRKREKSSGKTHLFNIITIEAMDGTAGQAQVKLSLLCSVFLNLTTVPEFIDPVFAKTSPKRSFSVIETERFGLVWATTGSINSGTGIIDPSPAV